MDQSGFKFDSRLDNDFLSSIYDGDSEHAAMVFEQFLDMIPEKLKEVEDSFNEGIMENFRQKIHKIKPVFSFVGLTAISGKAEMIETSCRDITNIGYLSASYQDFKNNIEASLPLIKTELVRLKEQ